MASIAQAGQPAQREVHHRLPPRKRCIHTSPDRPDLGVKSRGCVVRKAARNGMVEVMVRKDGSKSRLAEDQVGVAPGAMARKPTHRDGQWEVGSVRGLAAEGVRQRQGIRGREATRCPEACLSSPQGERKCRRVVFCGPKSHGATGSARRSGFRRLSSVGRAVAFQAKCRRFKSCRLHHPKRKV